jgi:hypothetical protein
LVTFFKYLLFSFCTSCAFITQAQNIIVKPFLQNASPSEMTIVWETNAAGSATLIWGTSPFSLNNSTLSIQNIGNGSTIIHNATLNNLQDDSKYYYKINMSGGQNSSLYHFKTPAQASKETNTQLVAVSDMQRDGSHPNKFNEIVEDGIIPIIYEHYGPSISELEGILIPGDLVPTGGSYTQWKDYFFNPADSLFPYVPLYPVLGNHEYFGNGKPNFLKYFVLPENGPSQIPEECWYKDISNIRIVGLNSNSGASDQNLQLDWLGELLTSTCQNEDIDFVFAQLHHPFKSELWTPGENDFTGKVIDSLSNFTSLCNKASIHFFGHTHAYSRGQSQDHKHLWINVATAGGAIDNWGEFPNADYEEFVKSQDDYGFVMIEAEAGLDPLFTIKRYSRGDQDIVLDNVLKDEITIFKHEIKPSKPYNIYPAEGDTLLSNCIILKGSQFKGVYDTIQAANWEIALSGDFQDSVIVNKWFQNENYYNEVNLQLNDDLTDINIEQLAGNKTYHWRVRYRDQNLEWSEWSDPSSFFVNNNIDTLSANLILNNGAENGINNWTGDIEALFDGECDSVDPYSDDYNFAVGGVCQNESAFGIAKQTIDLSSFSTTINNGNASTILSGYLRDYSGSDVPEMYIEFFKSGELIASTLPISNINAIWTKVSSIDQIPSGADQCNVVLTGTRNAGNDNDCYFDDLELYVVTLEECSPCFGKSLIDLDNDGFCDDVDCNDNNGLVYPGAIEHCDGIDNNCDGQLDNSDYINWNGGAGTPNWNDSLNWDQKIVPLPCQNVIINQSASVVIDSIFSCKSLQIKPSNSLSIESSGMLLIDSGFNYTNTSLSIEGNLIINGRCDVIKSNQIAIEVDGILINNNKLNTNLILNQSVIINPGGRFDNLGKTQLK